MTLPSYSNRQRNFNALALAVRRSWQRGHCPKVATTMLFTQKHTHAGTRAQPKLLFSSTNKSQEKIRVKEEKKNPQLYRVDNQTIGSRFYNKKFPFSPLSLLKRHQTRDTRRDGERAASSRRHEPHRLTHQKKHSLKIIVIFLFPTIRKSTAHFTLAVTHAARTERQDKRL